MEQDGLETRKWDGGLVRRRWQANANHAPTSSWPPRPLGHWGTWALYFRTFRAVLHKAPNMS